MRVIAGTYRSRPLRSLPGAAIRPTTDRLRETLFDVLAASRDLHGARWLDLYAGTGAVGIEALSRGAREVVFVESSKKAAALVRRNLASLGIRHGFQLVESKVVGALRRLEKQGMAFDLVFLDPPYAEKQEYPASLDALASSHLLAADALVIAEHDKRFDPGDCFGALQRVRSLKQGDAVLSFYRREAA